MKKDERGLRIFGEFRDSYGSRITVKESSIATARVAWIFCESRLTGDQFSPHLTRAHARRLIRILQRFIDAE